jgi:predicted regulator of Ras-like GTPase activity (Roadblock/LC7/MglB family)
MLNQIALDDRIGKCQKILVENPQSQIFAALADAMRKKGELDQAFRACRTGLRLHPGYGAGHLVMAKVHFDRKMYDWAESELSKAIELDGRTRGTEVLQAEINIKQKNFKEAGILVNELISADPGNQLYHEMLDEIEVGKAEERRKQIELNKKYAVQAEDVAKETFVAKSPENIEPLSRDEVLQKISLFPGVNASFFTNENGLMTNACVPEYFDQESYAALSAEIYRFANENVSKIDFGQVKHLFIEMSGENIWLVHNQDQILVMVLAASSNLGSLKLKLSNILKMMAPE